MQPVTVQFVDLLLIQLSNWRWSWRGSIILGMVAPILFITIFSSFAADSGERALGYVLTGNMVLALLLDGVGKTSSNFMFMRENGTLDYFATLPIYRMLLIGATVIAFLLLALPSLAVTLVMGTLILGVPLQISPLIVVVVPLISLSLSGLGAVIGLSGRTPEEANTLTNLTSLLLFGFGPVVIPAERLPDFVVHLSLLSPATYAASALRQVVLGQPDRIPLLVDILALLAITALLLWVAHRRMSWRGRG